MRNFVNIRFENGLFNINYNKEKNVIMNYKLFLENVKKEVAGRSGKDAHVVLNHIIKNNGRELDGIAIMEKSSHIAPTIYLNGYYEQYMSGRSIESVADEVVSLHIKNRDGIRLCSEYFESYGKLRKVIVYKLINYEKNKKLLSDVPHKRILDLAVVFYCLIDQSGGVSATALIHREHIKKWGITEETLYNDALKNTPVLLKSSITPMSSLLHEIARECGDDRASRVVDEMECEGDTCGESLYVLTNSSRVNGAACILYDNLLGSFAEVIHADLYILPSSVHEVILLPKLNSFDKSDLLNMVREVNEQGVAEDEVLSDNVYEYNRKDGVITL